MQALHNVSTDCQRTASTPADNTTVRTLSPLASAIACEVSVETTSARMTFDGTTPTTSNGHVMQQGTNPVYLPFAPTIKWISTAVSVSTVNVTWLFV